MQGDLSLLCAEGLIRWSTPGGGQIEPISKGFSQAGLEAGASLANLRLARTSAKAVSLTERSQELAMLRNISAAQLLRSPI